jgi:hypothetical protein
MMSARSSASRAVTGRGPSIARSHLASGSAGPGGAATAWTRAQAWSIEAAGPALIAGAVLATMWRTVLGRIPNGDALTLWVPLWTYLGRTLHAGHLPLWQTNLMSGAPFASDAQSGWGYYEPMVLFTFLSPAHAIRAMLVLQPLTAGIALWWFLRSEGLPRFAACCGGLALALAVTESSLVAALPFSGSLAWTAVTLGCCSRLFAAETWTRRVVWVVPATVAWGQIAAAHAGLGTLMGSVTLITYIAFRTTRLIRSGRWTGRATTGLALVFGIALAGVNLMFLAPRVAGVGETSLSLGYPQLAALGRVLFGTPPVPYLPGLGAGPGWPLTLASAPGAYLGAAVLFGVWLAFSGSWRRLAWPFVTTGVLVYLASLAIVADAIPDGIGQTLIVGLYLHAPYWIGYELVLVLPVLGAIGLASWPDSSPRARRTAVAATAALLMLLPLLLGVGTRVPIVIAVGAAAVVAILWFSDREPRAVWALPLVLLAELALAHVVSVPTTATTTLGPIPVNISPLNHFPLTRPVILNSSPFQRPMTAPGGGRYILIDSSRAKHDAEPHGTIDGATEPAWFLNWGLVSGTQSVQAYRAVVLLRYWEFVRAMGSRVSNYEHIRFTDVPPTLANLLSVGWVVRPIQDGAIPGETRVRATRRFALYRRNAVAPRASLITNWRTVDSPDVALAFVRDPAFRPNRQAVVEGDTPALGKPGPPIRQPTPRYVAGRPGTATIIAHAVQPSLLLIRTPYAAGWTATIDGHSASVLPADYVDQGVFLPAGRHVVKLTFTDPWVLWGVYGSLATIVVLLLVAAALRGRGGPGHAAEPTPVTTPSD